MSAVHSTSLRQLLSAIDRLNTVDEPARSLARSMARVCVDEGREVTAKALMTAAQETLDAPHVFLESEVSVQFPAGRPTTFRKWRQARHEWQTVRVLSLLAIGGLMPIIVGQAASPSVPFSIMSGLVVAACMVASWLAFTHAGRGLQALTPVAPELSSLEWSKSRAEGGPARAYLERVEHCEMSQLLHMDVEAMAHLGISGK